MSDTHYLQEQLVEHCRKLEACSASVRESILDQRHALWCCLPVFDNRESKTDLSSTAPSDESWFKLADQLADIYMKRDSVTHHGVMVCDHPALLDALRNFNALKTDTAQTAKLLKKGLLSRAENAEEFGFTGDSLNSYALVRDEFLSKGRDRDIHLFLRENHIEQLNFKKATKQIKITEPNISRFRYIWSKTNYRKRALKGSELFVLANHYRYRLNNKPLAGFIEERLAEFGISSTTKLYRLAFTNPTLKANYKFVGDDGDQWGHCLASSIVVLPQPKQPSLIWQAEPSPDEIDQAREQWTAKSKLEHLQLTEHLEVYR